MLLAGTSAGGGRSLKTLRPSLSTHCHCAAAPRQVEHANAFLATVKQAVPDASPVECYGPMPAPMPRRAGYVRSQLLLAAPARGALHAALAAAVPALYAAPEARRVRWSLDVDPLDLY